MISRRQTFVTFLLVAALASLFVSPLLPSQASTGRHLTKTSFVLLAPLALLHFTILSIFLSLIQRPAHSAARSERLIEMHCARLC
jgi:hypothetical protein